MDISVVIQAYNEEENLPKLFESLKGIEDIVLIDHKSTDKTAELAKSLGAKVITRENSFDDATEEDVQKFNNAFGFDPQFKEGDKIWNGEKDSNEAMLYAKNDWVFMPDADEIVTWDLEEIKKLLPDHNQIRFAFCHGHDGEGKCTYEFAISKFFRKSENKWVGRIHGVIVPTGVLRSVFTDKMRVDHYQKTREYRKGFLARLEFSVAKDWKVRDMFYLAREYTYHKRYEDAIKVFKVYLKKGVNDFDRGEAYMFMGRSYLALKKIKEATDAFVDSLKENDTRREPFFELAIVYKQIGLYHSAAAYLKAALELPKQDNGYLNNIDLYTWKIHNELMLLYYYHLNDKKQAQEQWLLALKHRPNDEVLLNDGRWMV